MACPRCFSVNPALRIRDCKHFPHGWHARMLREAAVEKEAPARAGGAAPAPGAPGPAPRPIST